MSERDPHITDADPQHYANPVFQGIDYFALNFVKQREAMLRQFEAQKQAAVNRQRTDQVLDESEVKADIGGSNEKYASGALKREILNSYYNHPLILHDFASGRGKNLEAGQSRGPALIIGSGPTLNDYHDLVRGWTGGIFCSSSQAVTMLALGKSDFHCVVVDVKTVSDEFMPLDAFDGKNVKMITHPGIDPEIVQTWRWEKLYFRIIVHGMPHYIEALPVAYPMIKTTLYVYGCVAATQIMTAKLMGYNPLFLVGCDFGYPDDRARFSGFKRIDGKWVQDPPSGPPIYTIHPKVIFRNGCPSDHFQAYYKQTFFNCWRLTLSDIFRVGPKGGLYEVPEVSAEEVLRTQGNLPPERFVLSNKDKQDIAERYLLQYGTYTFEFPSGQTEFVVFDENYQPATATEERDCGFCGKKTSSVHPTYGFICSKECLLDFQLKKYLEAMNSAFLAQKMPGVLILGEERGRLKYLRDDEAWARKEQRWQWVTRLPQSQTGTIPETPSESG